MCKQPDHGDAGDRTTQRTGDIQQALLEGRSQGIRLQHDDKNGHERRLPVKLQGSGERQDERKTGLERNQEPRGVELVEQPVHLRSYCAGRIATEAVIPETS